MNRPTGVSVIAVLTVISGILMLLMGGVILLTGRGFLLGSPEAASAGMTAATSHDLGLFLSISSALMLMFGIFQLVLGYATWNLKPWAWTAGVAITVLTLIAHALRFFNGDRLGAVMPALIGIVILLYLFSPTVKTAFKKA